MSGLTASEPRWGLVLLTREGRRAADPPAAIIPMKLVDKDAAPARELAPV